MATYRKQSSRSVDEVFARIQDTAKANGFGVLHTYDFKQILAGKGHPIAHECRVLEVCNPQQASEVLGFDMALNMALPCRISVYEDGAATTVAMLPPSALLELVSQDPRIAPVAAAVERSMERIIEQAL